MATPPPNKALSADKKNLLRYRAAEQWWTAWFEQDYSWDGLSQKPWHGWVIVQNQRSYDAFVKKHGLPEGCPSADCRAVPADVAGLLPKSRKTRPATLQDYWRDQEEKLEGQKGSDKKYTTAHLPPKYEDGKPSWKHDPGHKNWRQLSRLMAARLSCGAASDAKINASGAETVTGRDGRAQFAGCVLPGLNSQDSQEDSPASGFHVTLERAAFLKPLDCVEAVFASPVNFSHALFAGGYVNFRNAQFSSGDASFAHAVFTGGSAYFRQTQFAGGAANFTKAQFLGGDASFRGAEFSGGAVSFKTALFAGGQANFENARFSGGNATFKNAQFSGGGVFFGNVNFSGGDAVFTGIRVSGGGSYFRNAEFSGGNAVFENAEFLGGGMSFGNAEFSGGEAIFRHINVSGGRGYFDKAVFSGGHASFRGAKFSAGIVTFGGARFEETFDFHKAVFKSRALFTDTVFPPPSRTDGAFRAAKFLSTAAFQRRTVITKDGIRVPQHDLYFPFNAFDGTFFKSRLVLARRGDAYAKDEFDRTVSAIHCDCEDDIAQKDVRFAALERGCEQIKDAMTAARDGKRAHRYYKFERLARLERPSTPKIARRFEQAYGAATDYGGSLLRPLLGLFLIWVGFSVIYGLSAYFMGVSPSDRITSLLGPMDFSAAQTYQPFWVWLKAAVTHEASWAGLYFGASHPAGWTAIKALAALQSILSLTGLGLLAYVAKQKFDARSYGAFSTWVRRLS